VRQPPGIRRVLDAMRQMEEEAPGLPDEAMRCFDRACEVAGWRPRVAVRCVMSLIMFSLLTSAILTLVAVALSAGDGEASAAPDRAN
jgi:hypothetical protein